MARASELWLDDERQSKCLFIKFKTKNEFTPMGAGGPFLESPGNFAGPKSNIQIKI